MTTVAASYNNVGICATALMSVLRYSKSLPTSKALLVFPLAMHEDSLRYFSDGRTAPREIAAFVAMRPELIANFPARFNASLVPSLNAIQLLAERRFIELDREIHLLRELNVDKSFGKRANRINIAAKNIAAALTGPADEIYLNLRVQL